MLKIPLSGAVEGSKSSHVWGKRMFLHVFATFWDRKGNNVECVVMITHFSQGQQNQSEPQGGKKSAISDEGQTADWWNSDTQVAEPWKSW